MEKVNGRWVAFYVNRQQYRAYVKYATETSILSIAKRDSVLEFNVQLGPRGRILKNIKTGNGPSLWAGSAADAFFYEETYIDSLD